MAKTVLLVRDFAKALVEAGVLHEEDLNNITRVVLDANASNGTVEVHITRIGDDPNKIMDGIRPVLKGIFDGHD